MKEEHSGKEESKRILYEELEAYAREKIREHLQDLLEQEVTEWLGRGKGERKGNALEQPGYRNGYGKVRRFTLSLGTVEIRRPRVRNLDERFQSRTLPLFKRQTKQVRDLIKEKAALLVVIGVMRDGQKRFLALEPGYRESKESWGEVLRQLKKRGVKSARLFVGDGNLGLWAAVGEIYPQAQEQLCWNHKMQCDGCGQQE